MNRAERLFLLVLALGAVAFFIIHLVSVWKAPLVTRAATVRGKRVAKHPKDARVSGNVVRSSTIVGMARPRIDYYVIFELDDRRRVEFQVDRDTHEAARKRMQGILTWQDSWFGLRFVSFEPEVEERK